MARFKLMGLLLALAICIGCKQGHSDFATIEIEKEFDFGTVSLDDTIMHTFTIKNTSDVPLKISEIGTGCGCTGAIISDSIIPNNGHAEIEVQFIPKKEQTGKIAHSIVMEANTNPPFTVFYLKGFVSQ